MKSGTLNAARIPPHQRFTRSVELEIPPRGELQRLRIAKITTVLEGLKFRSLVESSAAKVLFLFCSPKVEPRRKSKLIQAWHGSGSNWWCAFWRERGLSDLLPVRRRWNGRRRILRAREGERDGFERRYLGSIGLSRSRSRPLRAFG